MRRSSPGTFGQRTCPGVTVARVSHTLGEMTLDDFTKRQLQRVVEEGRQLARIEQDTSTPRRRVLLVGPPGTRKTTAAAALSGELGLPLIAVQFDALVAAHTDSSAGKLGHLLDAVASIRGVYCIDGFDAPTAQSAPPNDAAAVQRLLNRFLRVIQQHHASSLVVVVSHHQSGPPDWAEAVHFDDVIEMH